MPLRKVSGPVVPIDECKRRALEFLGKLDPRSLANASQVAYHIWPETRVRMRAQGAGLIGARILHLLEKDGHVRWTVQDWGKSKNWGYAITSTGHAKLKLK